jgi:hypothetical protein
VLNPVRHFRLRERLGHRVAAVYTLIQTCVLNDVDPQAWLAYVLAKLPDHPAKRIDTLLPWNWKASQMAVAAAAMSFLQHDTRNCGIANVELLG